MGDDYGKKVAGAAGGESGARAHGPALGGEAGSVLIVSLSAKCPRMPPPVAVSLLPVVCRYRYPLQRQPNELQHMRKDLRRAIANLLTPR